MAEQKTNRPWPQVLAIGDALMDYQYWVERIPAPGQDVQILQQDENTGGSAANSAVGIAWLGVSCGFWGRLGQDAIGDKIQAFMHQNGVDTRLIQRSGSTGYVLSMIDPTGERTMFSFRGAASEAVETQGLYTALPHAKVVLLSGYLLTHPQQARFALDLAGRARSAGVLVALDACPKFDSLPSDIRQQALTNCDIFLPNREELAGSAPGDWQDNLQELARQIPCIAVKLGGEGALLHTGPGFAPAPDLHLLAPPQPVESLDTTGAGDAFNAGFLAALVQGLPPEKWLETGNWLAGQVISIKGATGLYKNPPPSRSI